MYIILESTDLTDPCSDFSSPISHTGTGFALMGVAYFDSSTVILEAEALGARVGARVGFRAGVLRRFAILV